MLRLDTSLFIATQNDPGGPIITDVDDGIVPMIPATDSEGRVTKSGAIAYLLAYAVLASFLVWLFWAI